MVERGLLSYSASSIMIEGNFPMTKYSATYALLHSAAFLCMTFCTNIGQARQYWSVSTQFHAAIQPKTKKNTAAWRYDPRYEPITLTELRLVIRDPNTTAKKHSSVLNRAAVSHLTEYAVYEYNQQRRIHPDNPLLQSAFGSGVIKVNVFKDSYKPSNQKLYLSQRRRKFIDTAIDAMEYVVRHKGMNIAYCWSCLGCMKSVGFQSQWPLAISRSASIKTLERSIELDPEYPNGYDLLSSVLLEKYPNVFDPQRSLALARKAAELDPKFSDAYYNQAIALSQLKRDSEAQIAMNKCGALLPPIMRHSKPK